MSAKKPKDAGKVRPSKFKLPAGVTLLAKPVKPGKDFHCVRCNWEWPARKVGELPARCPNCSSPGWNKARVLAVWRGGPCKCRKCKHEWTPARTAGVPVKCPDCQSFDWNGNPALPSAKPAGV